MTIREHLTLLFMVNEPIRFALNKNKALIPAFIATQKCFAASPSQKLLFSFANESVLPTAKKVTCLSVIGRANHTTAKVTFLNKFRYQITKRKSTTFFGILIEATETNIPRSGFYHVHDRRSAESEGCKQYPLGHQKRQETGQLP